MKRIKRRKRRNVRLANYVFRMASPVSPTDSLKGTSDTFSPSRFLLKTFAVERRIMTIKLLSGGAARAGLIKRFNFAGPRCALARGFQVLPVLAGQPGSGGQRLGLPHLLHDGAHVHEEGAGLRPRAGRLGHGARETRIGQPAAQPCAAGGLPPRREGSSALSSASRPAGWSTLYGVRSNRTN